MDATETKQYKKALAIVNAYPEALKIIERYSIKMNKEKNIQFNNSHIDLRGELSVRACNVIKQYFKNKSNLSLNEWNFPIEKLFEIDMDLLLRTQNCGKHTHSTVYELLRKLKPK